MWWFAVYRSYLNIVENLVELILGFFIALVISLLGPWYNTIGNEYGAYVIPFFILVIISIPTLFSSITSSFTKILKF